MDVVYLFHNSESVRIPFFTYNPDLFRRLIHCNGVQWDSIQREFVFRQNETVGKRFNWNLPVPSVHVDDNSPNENIQDNYHPKPLKITGFFDRPWRIAANADNRKNTTVDSSFKDPEKPLNSPTGKTEKLDSPFSFPVSNSQPDKLSEHWRNKLEAELRARKYSKETRRAYIYYNRLICRTLQKTPEEINPHDVTQFLAMMEKDKKYSASAMNLAISAIKFFFRNLLKDEGITERHRPHQDGRLPVVLSKEEITKILSSEKNPKHRLLLMLVYSSGLRVSEVVALKKEHIDLSRKVIYIRLGKGRKDRSTILSDKAAQFILEYYDYFGTETWLFPGQNPKRPLSIRSAQYIFDKALRRAQILKNISIHSLRHTFATHLLENGTDIRYIQSLLGHASLRATERYTHVARRSILNIKSPLDTI